MPNLVVNQTKEDLDEESRLQKRAESLDVNYYTSFAVVTVESKETGRLSFPVAEVYEKGRWRYVVIGGRPYDSDYMAASVVEAAKTAQERFILGMSKKDRAGGYPGLTNPIDNWRPYQES